MERRGKAKGFTLTELMVVVAIMGVMASVALPKFANLIVKSKEAAVKGNLGAVRSAVSIYYNDNQGVFPQSAAFLDASLTTGGKYLREIPYARVPPPANHLPGNTVTGAVTDTGNWFYSNSIEGHVAVACTHTDVQSSVWSAW